MSTFKSNTPGSGRTLRIRTLGTQFGFVIQGKNSDGKYGKPRDIVIDPADAPTIALAVMKAGQRYASNTGEGSAYYARIEAMNWLITARDRAEAETKRSARNKRRDDLAKKFKVPGYIRDSPFGKLVDHYLDLEDEAAK